MPATRHLIDSKWVFKKKRYGQFRAHIFTQGYTQIIVVDFTNNYSTGVIDVTIRVILLL